MTPETPNFTKVLKAVPDEVLFDEAKKRRESLRKADGPYATLKKLRKCKGCKVEGTARWRRSHKCPSGLPQSKR